jgi:hypothetical protein
MPVIWEGSMRKFVSVALLAVVLSAFTPAQAATNILLSDVVYVDDHVQGSYTDQSAINRGNEGAWITNSAGNLYNGSGLLSSAVNDSGSTAGAILLHAGLNAFYIVTQDSGATAAIVNFMFGGANSDTTVAGISGQADINGNYFSAPTNSFGYVTPGGLSTIYGNQIVTLTDLTISNSGLGPFANGMTVGYNNFNGADYNAIVARVTLDVEFVTSAVPEPASWTFMIVGFGAIGFVMRRRQSAKLSYA